MSDISIPPYDANRIFGDVIPTKGHWYDFETAPKDGTDILIFDGTNISIAYFDPEENCWIALYCEIMNGPIWHSFQCWMPLPEK